MPTRSGDGTGISAGPGALTRSGMAGRWSSLLGGADEQLVDRDVARAGDDVGDGVGDVLRLEGLHRGVPRLVLLADVAGELGGDGAGFYGADPRHRGWRLNRLRRLTEENLDWYQ